MNDEARGGPVKTLAVGPSRVFTGSGAIDSLARCAATRGDRVIAVVGPTSWPIAEPRLLPAFRSAGVVLEVVAYEGDVTETQIEALCFAARGMDAVVGVGGGKALDAAKLVAQRVGSPVFTVPTSPATCAAWTALSNVYSKDGGWLGGVSLDVGPDALALDYDLILTAPRRLLASGIVDAMAKWYEAEVAVNPSDADATTLAAMELAHHLHKQLVRNAQTAMQDFAQRNLTPLLCRVLDGNIVVAGAISGLGGSRCRSAAAHAVANGLTHAFDHRLSLHGEKVAFGILVQLVLMDRPLSEIEELINFFGGLGISSTLEALLGGESKDITKTVSIALEPDSSIHCLNLPLDSALLARAIHEVDALARHLITPNSLRQPSQSSSLVG